MIKWLIVTALLVNGLAFYLLQSRGAADKSGVSTRLDSRLHGEPIAQIVLLAELKQLPLERQTIVVEHAPQEPIESAGSNLPVAKFPLSEEAGQSVLDGDVETVRLMTVEAASEPADVQPQALISELPVPQLPISRLPIPKLPIAQLPNPKSPNAKLPIAEKQDIAEEISCVTLGRFDNKKDALALLEKLQNSVGVLGVVKAIKEGLERFLVYLPPLVTQSAAKRQQSELLEKGFRSSLYYKGELKNGLSLGYFGSSANAHRRYQRLLAAGYEVVLKPMVVDVLRFNVVLKEGEADRLSALFWQDLAHKYPNVSTAPVVCASGQPNAAKVED